MEVQFYWHDYKMSKRELLDPRCVIYEGKEAVYMGIAYFLIDDEGLGISHLQQWLKEGLEQIEKVSRGELQEYDMWGQSLGALIRLDKVRIYWGDEEYPDDYLEFEQFRTIVSKWYEFLLGEPDLNRQEIFFV